MSLLQMSLSGTVLVVIALVIRAAAFNKLPKMTFLAVWYIALLRLLLPVVFRLPFRIFGEEFGSITGGSVSVLDTFENSIMDFVSGVLPTQSSGIENGVVPAFQDIQLSEAVLPIVHGNRVLALCSVVWAVGVAVTAGVFIVSWLCCRREFRAALPVRNDFTSTWRRKHPLWRTIEIRQLTGLSTPLAYGIVHPIILMPKDIDWEDEYQVRYILFHEYVHICRFDAVGKLIASAALCIHWFNPFVWILYFVFNRDIELSCDECVIRHFGGKNRKNYAMALLRMEEQRSNLAPFGNYFSKNATEERIKAIIKYKKKTRLALALAVIVVIVGTLGAFAGTPKTEDADFGAVLQEEAQFFYVSEGAVEVKNIEDVPALFDPDDAYMKIWNFAVVDLDGDGKSEVILSVYGAAGDMGGKLVLHQMDGKIYGYTADYRSFEDLKMDGTYGYTDPGGVLEGGICSIENFTETGYIIDKITYGRGTYEGWDTFVVDHQPATEEEYWAAAENQARKPDAEWYDFTDENIKSVF